MKFFDDIFRENVYKAFSYYNAEHLADKGWNSFVIARERKRRLISVLPLWAKAASIAVFVAAGTLTGYLIINRRSAEATLAKPETESKSTAPAIRQSESGHSVLPVISKIDEPHREKSRVKHAAYLSPETVTEHPAYITQDHQEVNLISIDSIILPVISENRFLPAEDSINHTPDETLRKLREGESKDTVMEEATVKRSGRTSFMAGMSGMLAHVEDAASTVPGIAVGFYVEQKITERISFSPGLVLAVNSLSVDNNSGAFISAYSSPVIAGNSGTLSSYNGQLNMFAMELPLNIIFKVFNRGRSGMYLSAGTSTLIYFSQQFTGDFVSKYTINELDASSGLMTSVTKYSTTKVNNSYGTSVRTDFFGLANISAGYSLPYGKTATILIEPFMQIPVSNLTALNLRVHYGGISVKIRFGSRNNEK